MPKAYDDLEGSIKQVMDRAPWFQRLNVDRADVTVQALYDAKLRVSSPDSPGIVQAAALALCDTGLVRFQVQLSISSPTLFRAYNVLLKLCLKGESIVDQSLYERLHEEEETHFIDDSDYNNFDIYQVEKTNKLGIGIYDEKQVAIGAYNAVGEGEHFAMILCSTDAVVEWGSELFVSKVEEARPAMEPDSETVTQ